MFGYLNLFFCFSLFSLVSVSFYFVFGCLLSVHVVFAFFGRPDRFRMSVCAGLS